ncbi:MAG: C-GCAxxG-C-C family protein [Candidatus Zixiibacteriota bacterium]
MDNIESFVNPRVEDYYHNFDHNCAMTTLYILAEYFNIKIEPQVIDSANGLGGLGEYGGQCGLVSGAIMFIGIRGRERGWDKEKILEKSREYAAQFHNKFNSLECKVLRPEGFKPENPPNICEPITCRAIKFDIEFITNIFSE